MQNHVNNQRKSTNLTCSKESKEIRSQIMKHEVSRWRRGTAQMESESDSTLIAIMWPLLKTIKYSKAIGHHASVIS